MRKILTSFLLLIATFIFSNAQHRELESKNTQQRELQIIDTEERRVALVIGNGAYTDARLEDDTPPLSGGLKGDELPFTPEISLGLNADYEWSVGAQSTAFVGGSLRYLSDQTGTYDLDYRLANGRQREISSYEVLDLQAGIDFGRYSLELYAKNVTDSDGQTSLGTVGTVPNGAIGTGVIRPFTIGLTLGLEF